MPQYLDPKTVLIYRPHPVFCHLFRKTVFFFQRKFWTKTRLLGRQMPFLTKINAKNVFWPHTDIGFCGLATQNTAKITQGWLKANLKDPWSKEIWPASSKLTQKGLLASHGQWILLPSHPKNSQNHPALVKANLKDHWSKEIWPPSSKLIQKRSFGLTRTVDFVA